MMVFLKSTVRPWLSVILPSSSTCKKTLKTSGYAFSIFLFYFFYILLASVFFVYLQEDIKYIRMRLLDLIKEHH
jgi:hypothetical protein